MCIIKFILPVVFFTWQKGGVSGISQDGEFGISNRIHALYTVHYNKTCTNLNVCVINVESFKTF